MVTVVDMNGYEILVIMVHLRWWSITNVYKVVIDGYWWLRYDGY